MLDFAYYRRPNLANMINRLAREGTAMKRYYYISENLDDLDRIEDELEQRGIVKPQIHVLSRDDRGVETHRHLNNTASLLKQDVVHGTIRGLLWGLLAAAIVLAAGYFSGLPETYSWMPFVFLALVVFGFVTWSGGFYGIQTPHHDFRRFQRDLDSGKHIFMIDVDPEQERLIREMEFEHPELVQSGTGEATPRWVVMGQKTFKDITSTTFP